MLNQMSKIIVIGCPGSGKSTFSKKLQAITDIPLYHLDMIYWNKDKTHISKELFIEELMNIFKDNQWIIDGNYNSTLELRFQYCDTIIFLDYPTESCLSGIYERSGKKRSDLPWVENDIDVEFKNFIINFNTHSRTYILDLFKQYSNKNIIILKDRTDADAFLRQVSNKERNVMTSDIYNSVKRINKMEWCFNIINDLFYKDPQLIYTSPVFNALLDTLMHYYTSGTWLKDYILDEQGYFNTDLKRGVLSEDGIDTLLNDIKNYKQISCIL